MSGTVPAQSGTVPAQYRLLIKKTHRPNSKFLLIRVCRVSIFRFWEGVVTLCSLASRLKRDRFLGKWEAVAVRQT